DRRRDRNRHASYVSFLVDLSERADFRAAFRSLEEGEELIDGVPGVTLDPGGGEFQRIAEQETDLHVAADQPEEGAKRVFRVVEDKQACRPARLEQRLQPLADGETAIVKNDPAEIAFAGSGVADRYPVQRDRGAAGNDLQPVGRKGFQAVAQRLGVEMLAVVIAGAHLRRLPSDGRGKQPVAVAEPFVKRLLGAARALGDGGHGDLVAALDEKIEHGVEYRLLALGRGTIA